MFSYKQGIVLVIGVTLMTAVLKNKLLNELVWHENHMDFAGVGEEHRTSSPLIYGVQNLPEHFYYPLWFY